LLTGSNPAQSFKENPARLAHEVLIALSADGEFGGVPLDRLAKEIGAQIISGLRPRDRTDTGSN